MARAPGITQWVPLPYGEFGDFLRDPLHFLAGAQQRYGDVFRFRFGPLLLHYLFHPKHVRRILHDQQKNYLRGWHYRLIRGLAGDNLVVSEGDYWLRQRRMAQPAFHRQRLIGYAEVMIDATRQMLDRWEQFASAGTAIDIGAEMSRLSLAIASRTLFSRDLSEEADVVGSAFKAVAHYLEQRFNHPFASLPAWVPTANNRQFKAALRTLHQLVLDLIRERRGKEQNYADLLSMLMQARDEESGAAMTDEQLRSEGLAFLLAGHETTAASLTWTWYLLAQHAAIRGHVRAEVEASLGNRLPTVEDVPRLQVTGRVIDESLRMYPPIWAVPRQPVREDEIDGYRIPATSTVLLCPFVTHRHPGIWETPDKFDPDRFTPEAVAQRSKYAYFPFLGGPHQCIGNEFALLEMRLIVAMVMQAFDLELLPGQAIRPMATLTIRPHTPIRMTLRRHR